MLPRGKFPSWRVFAQTLQRQRGEVCFRRRSAVPSQRRTQREKVCGSTFCFRSSLVTLALVVIVVATVIGVVKCDQTGPNSTSGGNGNGAEKVSARLNEQFHTLSITPPRTQVQCTLTVCVSLVHVETLLWTIKHLHRFPQQMYWPTKELASPSSC